jgi:hypothetical protein
VKGIVLEWIGCHYNLAQVSVKDFPKLPGGTLVIENDGSKTLVFYDCLNERIMTGEPMVGKKRSYAYT